MPLQILKILEDVEHEGLGINVRGCGCLGQCGNGPNICITPPDVNVRGISTPAAVFRMLHDHCNVVVSDASQRSVQVRSSSTLERFRAQRMRKVLRATASDTDEPRANRQALHFRSREIS